MLVATLRGRFRPERPPRPVCRDLATGMRALLRHPVLRMLAVCLCFMNVTLLAAFSLLVLHARERLGLTEVGFGLLLASSAVGGIAGTLVAARLQARFGTALLLRTGL
ncbi:MAG TPA: hypothetical protein VKZ81_26815 [Pseudonocardia sp.]|uniref:hypothetical protein n=1 Tax=Pseudonocardia sp. TaxID=60912 RepID=UPI002B4AE868|nr:hypothetical protein [Pseudonocardia sp.]HLU59089.1 hypothetical protein [Pseudonocardia sp.]